MSKGILSQAGCDIKTIQSILRHSDIRLTVDRYGHLFPGAEASAVAKMRDAFTHTNATMRNCASMYIESAEQVATRFGQELSPEMQNPQEKPEDSEERLRPDLNRGWRICNPLP